MTQTTNRAVFTRAQARSKNCAICAHWSEKTLVHRSLKAGGSIRIFNYLASKIKAARLSLEFVARLLFFDE